jgi:hypothetical protein
VERRGKATAELGARRPAREEEESEPRRERKRGKWHGVQGRSPGVLLILKAASRTWLAGSPAQDTQVLCLVEEEEEDFAENPLGFGRFQEKKTAHFAIFCTLNGVQKF